MTDKEQIGKNLKKIILAKGYKSVEKFALENKIYKDIIYRIINGTRDPRFSTIIRITKALDIKIDALLKKRKNLGKEHKSVKK